MQPSRKNLELEDWISDGLERSIGCSELYLAVTKGDFRTLRKMIHSGADLNRPQSARGDTLIYAVILSKNMRMLEELLHAGANPNVKTVTLLPPLFLAITQKNLEAAKVLLDNGADVHTKIMESRWSLLHAAVHFPSVEICELLIERGIDINVRIKYDRTALHCAAIDGKTEIARLLVAEGADISATCIFPENDQMRVGSNVTPLFLATYYGHSEITSILIKAGADVNVRTSENITPLHGSSFIGPLKSVKMLLKAGAWSDINVLINHTDCVPLMLAIMGGQVDIAKELLTVEGIDINAVGADKKTPLILATSKGCLEIVKLLIAKGAPVNGTTYNMMTPLHIALKSAKDDIAEFLMEQGADIHALDACNMTPLHVACKKGVGLKIIKALCEGGANVDARMIDNSTPLHCAAEGNDLEIIKYLIDRGADCDAVKKRNLTVLHHAARNGNVKTVTYFLTKVSEIDAKSITLTTPLHCAVERGYPEVVEILLKSGSNVDAQDDTKRTPFHIALEKGHPNIPELLLKYNALVNLKDVKEECTPLFLAVKNGNGKLVNLMLDKGGDPNIANKFGVFPIHVATKAENVAIVEALLRKGAYFNVKSRADDYLGTPLDFARDVGNAKLIIVFELIRKLFCVVMKNKISRIECAVQAGAIVNARKVCGRTALHCAVSNFNSTAVKVLLTSDADISLITNEVDSPLQISVKNDCMDILEILLAYAKNLSFVKYNSIVNARVMEDGRSALHTAAENGKLHIVKLLLLNGAVYNGKNNSGKTPLEVTSMNDAIESLLLSAEKLFAAVMKEDGLAEVKKILGEDDSTINAREASIEGTPLYWSTLKGHTDIARALLSNGADYQLVTKEGKTPLHIAASEGNVEIVELLINVAKNDNAGKVDNFINAATMSGTVALHVASNLDVVKCLLQGGAMFDVCNGLGQNALELTMNDDIRKLLKTTLQMFNDVKAGVSSIMNTLNFMKKEELQAILGTRNSQGQTLVQVAQANAHFKIATKLRKKLA